MLNASRILFIDAIIYRVQMSQTSWYPVFPNASPHALSFDTEYVKIFALFTYSPSLRPGPLWFQPGFAPVVFAPVVLALALSSAGRPWKAVP